jgi:hypothetical protein
MFQLILEHRVKDERFKRIVYREPRRLEILELLSQCERNVDSLERLTEKFGDLPRDTPILAYCRGRYCVLSHKAPRSRP